MNENKMIGICWIVILSDNQDIEPKSIMIVCSDTEKKKSYETFFYIQRDNYFMSYVFEDSI